MDQLADFIRVRKLFAYGKVRNYFNHHNCVGYVADAVSVLELILMDIDL